MNAPEFGPLASTPKQLQRVHSVNPSITRLQRIIYIFCDWCMFVQVKYPFNQLRLVSPQGAKKRYRLDFPSQKFVPSTLLFGLGHLLFLVLATSLTTASLLPFCSNVASGSEHLNLW